MATSAEVQTAVDELGRQLARPVLVEDAQHAAVWWSVQGRVDSTRMRSILDHRCTPSSLSRIRSLRLEDAVAPVRTPAVPELDMVERWCVPIRSGDIVVGFLWVIDSDHGLAEHEVVRAGERLRLATDLLAERRVDPLEHLHKRAALLARLAAGADPAACEQLVALEHLRPDVLVGVGLTGGARVWDLGDGMSVHLDPQPGDQLASGPAVPLGELRVAVLRARAVRHVLAAGGVLERQAWDALGSWRLIVTAAPVVPACEIHPGAEILAGLSRPYLLETARTVLDLGGDVGRAAEMLHVHRTTLYYRLDRIEALTGVNLRTGAKREDLQQALRLQAYQRVAAEAA